MKNKKIKKINSVLSLVATVFLFFLQIKVATAAAYDVGKIMGASNPYDLTNSIFDDLGVNKDELKYDVQTFNVASSKKTPPQVSLFFNPADPSEGDKITATASPTGFLNDPKKLYYTWFLKSANCNTCGIDGKDDCTSDELKAEKGCNLNGDHKIDIEDYKIKAARIIANGGFIYDLDTTYSGSKSNSEEKADGYTAVSGGDDQREKPAHCYVHNISSGEEYEIDCGSGKEAHLFPNAPSETTGDGRFSMDEENFWRTDPNSNDTANLGHSDEANVAGLNANSFTWNYQKGDKIGVAVEGVSTEPTQAKDSSYKTMWAINPNPRTDSQKFSAENDYPKTTTISTTATTDPITGDVTTVTKTKTEEIDTNTDGTQKIVNEIATIKTTSYTQTVITDPLGTILPGSDAAPVQDADNPPTAPNPSYSTVSLAKGFNVKIDDNSIKTPSDLNELLYDALVSPQENTPGSNKLNISLSYFPTNPINDPSGDEGDLLTIHSTIPNAKDPNYLQYDWEVYTSDEASPSDWGNALLKTNLPESTQSIGLGIDTYKFKLKIPELKKYLRITLTATENVGEDYPRKNSQDVIIPVSSISANEQISAYVASATDDSANLSSNPSGVKLGFDLSKDIICNTDPLQKALCPVAKDQIIGLSVPENSFPDDKKPNFLWTIDGQPFSYSYCYFEKCDQNMQTGTAYFPILKEVGEQYTVNLTATDKDGKKVNLTKTFKVVDPKIEIAFADDVCPPSPNSTDICHRVVLGNYIDVNGKSFPDYSQLNFLASTGSDIKLKAVATGFPASPQEYTWNVDGDTINSSSAGAYNFSIDSEGVLTLPSKETQGESYNITVGALYTQDNFAKKALKNIWDVTYNQFYEKPISGEAVITMLDSTTAQNPSKKIFASIYSSAPAYLAFLLRIVLTAFVLLFTVKLVFSFSPEN